MGRKNAIHTSASQKGGGGQVTFFFIIILSDSVFAKRGKYPFNMRWQSS